MWTTELISGFSLIVALIAAAVPLLNGYWDRKQHRQLAAFAHDPSVGLEPPPSMLRLIVRKHWYSYSIAVVVAIQIGTMLFVLRGIEPITRGLLVNLIFIGLGIVWNVVMGVVVYIQGRFALVYSDLTPILRGQIEVIESIRGESRLLWDAIKLIKEEVERLQDAGTKKP